VTSFPPNRYVPITRTLLTILTFRVSFIHFSQLTPPPPHQSIHTSSFLAPYSASSRYRSQSLSPNHAFVYSPRPIPTVPLSNDHIIPTLLLSSAAPHHPFRQHHGNRAISASYFARCHIGPTNAQSIPLLKKKGPFQCPNLLFLNTYLRDVVTYHLHIVFSVLSGLGKLIFCIWEFYYLILIVCVHGSGQDGGKSCIAEVNISTKNLQPCR